MPETPAPNAPHDLVVTTDRAPALRPRMTNDEDSRPGLALTSRGLLRDGRPWLPVSGEMHYSRVPRARWRHRIRQMKAGGLDVVACYVPWLHHAPTSPAARFDDHLDIAAFVDLVREEGLDLVLRIGPWAHGEMRNGGFPDWVQAAPVAHRTNDPAYLALVRGWWTQLAAALDGRAEPGTVLGIQLDNELYDQPEHLRELKRIARECGLSAPLWTATAWGGAQVPDPDVFPVYGGYADGFWVDPGAPWDATFRQHFLFGHEWDDPGIGADLRDDEGTARQGVGSEWFPPATCELGGGMATAYHRRPVLDARDVAAVAHSKLGNGSTWQGYYMYVGGTNPGPCLQETQSTGYPNDMPEFDYDFHAPIGASGRLAASHAELRRQHAFARAFADVLSAPTAASRLPELRPASAFDTDTLRWAYRGDADRGVLFLSTHQPYEPLAAHPAARFRLRSADTEVVLPSSPVPIPSGTLAHWPVGIGIGGVRIDWLTASALTVLHGPGGPGAPHGPQRPGGPGEAVPTLVAVEDAGIPVELAVDGAVRTIAPDRSPTRVTTADGGALDVLVLPAADADLVWVQTDAVTAARLLLSAAELTWGPDGVLDVLADEADPVVLAYEPGARSFAALPLAHRDGVAADVAVATIPERAAAAAAASYGAAAGRQAAPGADVREAASALFRLDIPAADADGCLEISWAGDVAELLVDGTAVADRFWDGTPWLVSLADAGITAARTVQLRILPLAAESGVHVSATAQARRDAASGDLLSLDGVRLSRRARWREDRPAERP